jgi:hypothetical protein
LDLALAIRDSIHDYIDTKWLPLAADEIICRSCTNRRT